MTILNFEDFMKNYNSKNDTMNECQVQKFHNYLINPRDSKINPDKVFVNIDNGSQSSSHWTCFLMKDKKS